MNSKVNTKPTAARHFRLATRGSALALAQAQQVQHVCSLTFPQHRFDLKIIKTTGDKLQTASLSNPDKSLPKGLFTKELEVALSDGEADMAVHSLKDLPTELPDGLKLGAVLAREDVRDVLIYRGHKQVRSARLDPPHGVRELAKYDPNLSLKDFPLDTIIATSSTRRRLQVMAARPDLKVIEIRGNVGTRLRKCAEESSMDATILAFAGLKRLGFVIQLDGEITGQDVPPGLCATLLPIGQMMPCVGQAAIGIEIRENDPSLDDICKGINHDSSLACVSAERAFLRHLGGGCQSPVAAHATSRGDMIHLKAMHFYEGMVTAVEDRAPFEEAESLGRALAEVLG